MDNISNISSEEELLHLRNDGKISQAEYQDLLAAMKNSRPDNTVESATTETNRTRGWQTWFPFQSEATREICAHMTQDEKMSFMIRSALLGLWIAAGFAGPQCVILLPALFGIKRSALAISIAFIFLIMFLISIPFIKKRNKIVLCSTEWAKAKGYTADKI
jgi:hypothetical protein